MMEQTTAPAKYVTMVAVKLPEFWTEVRLQNAQITQYRSCGAKTPLEHHDLCRWTDFKLSALNHHSFQRISRSI